MGVRDRMTLALKTVVLVNSDVAASQQVADRYCAMYGIPLANQFVYAMGSSVRWAYTAGDHNTGRYTNFWVALNAHRLAIGAHAILSTAGCPVGIDLLNYAADDSVTVNFALLLGITPRIISMGREPFGHTYAGDSAPFLNDLQCLYATFSAHKGTQTLYDSTAIPLALDCALDSEHTSAGGGETGEYKFTTYKAAWNGDYSIMTNLLTGHVGYYTAAEASHPATLWDLSRVILGKTGNLQKPLAQQTSVVALACIAWIGANNGHGHTSKQALVAKRMQDAGLDLRYWYGSDQTVSVPSPTNTLLPVAGADYTWTLAELNAVPPVVTDCTYTYGFGLGFNNNMETNWEDTLVPSPSTGGIVSVGASYGNLWGKRNMVSAQFSYIQHMGVAEYNFHQGEREQSKVCDIWLNLLAGRTMTEAAWCSIEGTFLAVGDPLARPFA
jgi:hypothetical protein